MTLTHIDESGSASMVDVSEKESSTREARAFARITMQPTTLDLVKSNGLKKGDVLAVARIAGIQAAKQCSTLIPLCHPLMLTKIGVEFEINEQLSSIDVTSFCKLKGQTGVEMEALTAASIAALTVYDMLKAVQKDMEIGGLHVTLKDGGKSGRFEG